MLEVYLLNKGDSINKIKYEYEGKSVQTTNDKLLGYNYAIINSGNDDVVIVRNYHPYYIYNVEDNENIIDIMARGFTTSVSNQIVKGDKIIIKRPTSIRYIVKPLETLEDITRKFNVDKFDIINTNNLNTDKLFVGQILWI